MVLTAVGFWPSYFAVLGSAPWGFHLHGITATAWIVLLGVQSWSIHHRHNALHRALGIASLALYPLFLAGGIAVVLSMAAATAADDVFYRIYGSRLATMDITSVILLGYLYYKALADRKRVQLHARWLLSTPLPLLVPIVGRVISHWTPGLMMHGPQDFPLFAWAVRIAGVIALAFTAWLYCTAPRHGRPFLITGLAIAGQAVLFDTLGFLPGWDAAYRAIAGMPILPLLLAALIVGAAIDWFGWQAGMRRNRRSAFNTG
ncbi:hypothetical protein GCM10011395_02680 [Sphingomonas psychrolutea]|uniref:Cytochrome c oxidase assembly protein n=1 Tax=Sphingomonas psychrolutea TaxID=1259676 RepID=A0ABQ1G2D1_9SPHN|nr:hypothetical protein GCM10011395_02680 [Sphingomonas psychrolutea]